MKRTASIFASLTALLSLAAIAPPRTVAAAADDEGSLIVPGQRIGKMSLGLGGATVLRRFGKPDGIDAGMSQTRQIWRAARGGGERGPTLFIHTVANGVLGAKPSRGVTIDTVRTSSRRFRTASGVAVGSSLTRVRSRFPHVQRDRAVADAVVYSDARRGIAFEFDRDEATARCIGIGIFAPGNVRIVRAEDVSRWIKDTDALSGKKGRPVR